MYISKADLGRHLPNDLSRRIEVVDGVINVNCEKCDSNFYCGVEMNKYDFRKEYEVIIRNNYLRIGDESLLITIQALYDKLPEKIILLCDKRKREGLLFDYESMYDDEFENQKLMKMNKLLKELQKRENPSEEEKRQLERIRLAIFEFEHTIEERFEQSNRGKALRYQSLERAEKLCLKRNKKDIEEVMLACLKIGVGERNL